VRKREGEDKNKGRNVKTRTVGRMSRTWTNRAFTVLGRGE